MELNYKEIRTQIRKDKNYKVPEEANKVLFDAIEKLRENPNLTKEDIEDDILPRVNSFIKFKKFGKINIIKGQILIASFKFQNGIFNLGTLYAFKKNGFDEVDIFNNKVMWSTK